MIILDYIVDDFKFLHWCIEVYKPIVNLIIGFVSFEEKGLGLGARTDLKMSLSVRVCAPVRSSAWLCWV